MTDETKLSDSKSPKRPWQALTFGLILFYILAAGLYLRLVGLDWDIDQHLHPDERFLTMVESAIEPVGTPAEDLGLLPSASTQSWREGYLNDLPNCQEWGGYFDTACSPLNPNNRGYDFYVYGTLPIFIVRYAAEWLGKTGYSDVYLVGRALSALADLAVVVLVYAVARRLYDLRVGLLAAAFSAFSVLPIQQSHFFTVDTFTNFFIMLAVYFAVRIAVSREPLGGSRALGVESGESLVANEELFDEGSTLNLEPSTLKRFITHPLLIPSLLFGLALGMAVASKINAAPLALILPVAVVLYMLKLSPQEQRRQAGQVFLYLVLAALVSIVAFRVFQPYAFTGPGFFGFKPNQAWIDDLRSLRAQTGGDVDFPPALQWARRPIWFSLQNLVLWGLGLPLGLTAWAGFLWMCWRMFKGEWQKHALLWGWTAFYFSWQSMQWNSTMRYQLPIYPTLAIFAAWFVFYAFERGTFRRLNIGLGLAVLLLTGVYAFAFTRIYARPHPRVEATRWMIQNLPGPANIAIQTGVGVYNQPLSYPQEYTIRPGFPYDLRFNALADGELTAITFPHMVDRLSGEQLSLLFTLGKPSQPDSILASYTITEAQIPDFGEEIEPPVLTIPFDEPLSLGQEEVLTLNFSILSGLTEVEICGPVYFGYETTDGFVQQEILLEWDCIRRENFPHKVDFIPNINGTLRQASFGIKAEKTNGGTASKTLEAVLIDANGETLATETLEADFSMASESRGGAYAIPVSQGVRLTKNEAYTLKLALISGNGAIQLSGSALANESSWDDGLPLRMDGYDPFGGIYRGGLNFEMYWDDNQEKYDRFVKTLDEADYILITSSRQWGSTTRVPERYPLTSEYYKHLAGCPNDHTIEWCYNVAEPGMFEGDLGFDLIQTFQSTPSLAGFAINDQFSEEAFTVYDHPKVFVFAKTDDYNPANARRILGAVDLSKVIRITPKQADSHPGDLLLTPERLAEQRAGGTWSDYFNPNALHNRVEIVGVLVWYVALGLLGLVTYPLVRYAMPGLADRGYPLARMTGLLMLSALVWLAGSARIPFTRWTIGAAIGLMVGLGWFLASRQRETLRQEWGENRKYFLMVEGLILGFFIIGLLIRLGNPDLWHPWKGGEKPMDFSYFNAVLKSTSFPPYDPWFAGGYINYYYYGFMLVGVLVKFLGIVPSFAYNLILPTLLSLIAIGAFSVAWNLVANPKLQVEGHKLDDGSENLSFGMRRLSMFAGFAAALGMAVFGNLGALRMIFQGIQMNAAPGAMLEGAGFFNKFAWTVSGFFKTLSGTPLPFRKDEWYWNPSRVIADAHGSPITEFPAFTFLYADLHAHLIAMPVALLAVVWAISVVRSRFWAGDGRRSASQIAAGLLVGGVTIGALYPLNLSDIYTYLPLGVAALVYAIGRYVKFDGLRPSKIQVPAALRRLLLLVGSVAALALLSKLIYQPYWNWYGQGYSKVNIWQGTHTPLSEYFTHWGAFLFVIVSWMFYETVDWMAGTPVSALRRLEPYRGLILGGVLFLFVLTLVLGINLHPDGLSPDAFPAFLGIHAAWLVLPLIAWVGVLIFRPGLPDSKRMVLFLIGTGLALTLMVEIVVVSGDIGRMNTVFKFYLHAWPLFAVSAAAALGWLLTSLRKWSPGLRTFWQIALGFFVLSIALFPILASVAKIMDRMETTAPHSLDGMDYMAYATYHDEGVAMDLSQDYNAIRWMQDNVEGSPVIVEANSVEYHWGTRFTIYTGLPGVVGWNWHQRQQRTVTPHDWVFERVEAIHEFYLTEDLDWTKDFLEKYDVGYIVFGQLEQAKYAGPGLEKFDSQSGVLWNEVFRDRQTVIYEVIIGH